MNIKNAFRFTSKILLCALAFYGGTILGGMAATLMGLPAPELPAGADEILLGQYLLLVSLLLALALVFLLARNLSGGFIARWLTLAFLIWITHAVNNILEGAIFTSMSAVSLFTVVLYGSASLCCGAAAAWLFPPGSQTAGFPTQVREFFTRFSVSSWIWRMLVVWLAFPLIYLAFGRLVAPLVTDYYEQGLFNLALPSWNQILPILLLRSLLFLLACLPVLILWQGSKRSLFLSLGVTLFLLVGGLSMLQAYWMPGTLRIVHSLEILAGEMVYAAVVVILLARPNPTKVGQI